MPAATLTAEKPAKQAAPTASPDLVAIKARQQAAWSSGDYAVVGTTLQIVGEELCEALDLRAGKSVLDVAAGNGMVSLAAARRWCDVTSTDYVGSLLERGRARAMAEGLPIDFKVADAEALPFADDSFDTVVSTFGVMFTPNQEQAAAELLRVCKSGGQIGLTNWTPDGFIGQLFKLLGKYLPPPPAAKSPMLWGTRARLDELFAAGASLDQDRAALIQVSLSLCGTLRRRVQDLLRADAKGILRAGCASANSAGEGSVRSHWAYEHGGRQDDGCAE